MNGEVQNKTIAQENFARQSKNINITLQEKTEEIERRLDSPINQNAEDSDKYYQEAVKNRATEGGMDSGSGEFVYKYVESDESCPAQPSSKLFSFSKRLSSPCKIIFKMLWIKFNENCVIEGLFGKQHWKPTRDLRPNHLTLEGKPVFTLPFDPHLNPYAASNQLYRGRIVTVYLRAFSELPKLTEKNEIEMIILCTFSKRINQYLAWL